MGDVWIHLQQQPMHTVAPQEDSSGLSEIDRHIGQQSFSARDNEVAGIASSSGNSDVACAMLLICCSTARGVSPDYRPLCLASSLLFWPPPRARFSKCKQT